MNSLKEMMIQDHAIKRSSQRKKWNRQEAIGNIRSIMKNGENLGTMYGGKRHKNPITNLIVDKEKKAAIVYVPETNATITLLSPKELCIDEDLIPSIIELHKNKIKENDEQIHDTLVYQETERFLLMYEKEQLEEKIIKQKAKLMALESRVRAIESTLQDFEQEEDEKYDVHRRMVKSMAGFVLMQ